MARWLPVALIALAVGCPAPTQYREVRPGLSCERATRVAHRTLVQLGYTVTELVVASPVQAGVVAGTKKLSDGRETTGRVIISCDGQGASLQPVEDTFMPSYDFSRAFGYSFKTLVQRPDVEEPRSDSGLEVLVHALTAHEEVLDLGGRATATGALAVRITVRNHTDRAVAIDPAGFELVSAAGDSVGPLAGGPLAAALAPGAAGERVRREQLRPGRVAARTTVAGFLVYPAGTYREASVAIADVETGETEGFVTAIE